MLKHFLRTLTVAVLFSLTTVLAYAQSDTPKVEVGAQFALIRLRDLRDTNGGGGVRLGFNFTNSIAAEAEFNYFPGDLRVVNFNYSSNRTQGLFGVKYMALRSDKFGIGGKLRPGFVRFNGSNGPSPCGVTLDPASVFCQAAMGQTNFAMDFGGVFEYYPMKRVVMRFDIGDTIIRIKGLSVDDNGNLTNGFTSNNLQFNVGIGFRF